VGESGCGKSSVARALVGLVPNVGGSIRLHGQDCSSHKVRTSIAYRQQVQMVFQDPFGSLNPRMTVGEMIGEALMMRPQAGRDRSARHREVLRILELVWFPGNILDRYPYQFSGGQRQRLAIARALAVGPQVIVCDEVTSALDVSVQASVLNLLRDLQSELGLSYLLISHDLAVVRAMSDVVAVMYLGRIVEQGAVEDVFGAPNHPYTTALLSSIPTLTGSRKPAPVAGDIPDPRRPPTGCRFHTRCPVGPLSRPERTVCIELDPQPSHEVAHQAACHFAVGRDVTQFAVQV
jgi:oligopeptide/dipeptide ABC transporter ATP-binding protein